MGPLFPHGPPAPSPRRRGGARYRSPPLRADAGIRRSRGAPPFVEEGVGDEVVYSRRVRRGPPPSLGKLPTTRASAEVGCFASAVTTAARTAGSTPSSR